jgi:hypothetical protein
MIVSWQGLQRWRWMAAGLVAIAAFAVLAGRFWHPYYGFTKFVQLDEADAKIGLAEVRENPVFIYPGYHGYDGAAYAQIAFHPLLDSTELKIAVGNLPYRARRILGSALAWLLAGGNPARIANVYAGLNLAVWLGLAVVLWRLLPVNDARSWVAWAGVMFSAGALHSVRLALTDLLAATLAAGAIGWGEQGRGRGGSSLAVLAAAGLARETALAGVAGLWRGPWFALRPWIANAVRTVIVAIPLLLWLLYIQWKVGPGDRGLGNFTWPMVAWVEKWGATFGDYARHPDFRWLNTTTLLALIALTAQAAYFLRRGRIESPWWRVGAAGVAMMALLGTSVWEGHPGAATRVLLPMSVAFAVLVVRERGGWAWVVAGGLTVLSGVQALRHVPDDPRELAAGGFGSGAYVVRLDGGWHGVERDRRAAWAWSAQEGKLAVALSTRVSGPIRVRLKVRAISPRAMQIREGSAGVWAGTVETKSQWIEFPVTPQDPGRISLTLNSDAPSTRESENPDARGLSFAVYGVEVR